MSSLGSNTLWQSLQDLAFARGGLGEHSDAKFVRDRIAMMLWLPGFYGLILVAAWLQNPAILIGIPALAIILWLFAKQPGWMSRVLRRKRS